MEPALLQVYWCSILILYPPAHKLLNTIPSTLQLSKPIYGADKNVSIRFADAGVGVILTVIVVLILCLSVSGFAAYCYVHKIKDKTMPEEAPLAPSGPGYSSNLRNVDNINLICMLGNGKYGTVMKGLLHDQEVAVKIFPESHYPYYINERNIYSLPMMDSPSLLTYFGEYENPELFYCITVFTLKP